MPECYVRGEKFMFDWVKMGVKAAVHNIMHGSWNKGELEKYLEVVGVSNWIISRVKKNI